MITTPLTPTDYTPTDQTNDWDSLIILSLGPSRTKREGQDKRVVSKPDETCRIGLHPPGSSDRNKGLPQSSSRNLEDCRGHDSDGGMALAGSEWRGMQLLSCRFWLIPSAQPALEPRACASRMTRHAPLLSLTIQCCFRWVGRATLHDLSSRARSSGTVQL